MKNKELLDLIGEVNEDYIQAADSKVIRFRSRWKVLAACAACAALMLGAYPAYQATRPPLHGYVVMEGGGMLDTRSEEKLPQGEAIDVPGHAGEKGGEEAVDGTHTGEGGAPVDEEAANQYDRLLWGMGIGAEGSDAFPSWFAGAWIDHGGAADVPAWLTVAIVDGLRTPELEAEILSWTQGDVVFRDAKYSKSFLDGLMESVVAGIKDRGLTCGIGVDVMENCVKVDFYSDGAVIPDSVLAGLAKLDPDGDAILVRVFPGTLSPDYGQVKGPAPDFAVDQVQTAPEARSTPAATVDGGDVVYHGEDAPADAVPGGARVDGLPEVEEEGRLARNDLLPLNE